jgi:hypothetical protein
LEPLRRQLAAGVEPRQAWESFHGSRRLSAQTILAAAGFFAEQRQPALSVRALGTLAERCGGSPAALRAHAIWLAEFQQPDAALRLLDRLATTAAHRGLPLDPLRAAFHEQAGREPQAAAIRGNLAGKRGPQDQPDTWTRAVALTEFNAFFHRRKAGPDAIPHPLGAGFQQNLDADLRVVAFSNTGARVPVSIEEPAGHLVRGMWQVSPCGGHFVNAAGVAEYLIRRAMPGTYRIRLHGAPGTTVRVTLFTEWGRAAQQAATRTLFLEGSGQAMIEHIHRLGSAGP